MHNQKHSINRSPPRPVPVPGSPHRGRPGRLHRPHVPLTPASVAVVAAPGWNPVAAAIPARSTCLVFRTDVPASPAVLPSDAQHIGTEGTGGRTSPLGDARPCPRLSIPCGLLPEGVPTRKGLLPGGGSAEGVKGAALYNPAEGLLPSGLLQTRQPSLTI